MVPCHDLESLAVVLDIWLTLYSGIDCVQTDSNASWGELKNKQTDKRTFKQARIEGFGPHEITAQGSNFNKQKIRGQKFVYYSI